MMADEPVEDFKSSLADLTVNSKPLINMLTMLAEENSQYAEQIVNVIEEHLRQISPSQKLPAMYLVDSIIKNIPKSNYLQLFTKNIVHNFVLVFEKVDEKTRQALFKLRQTWSELFPSKKLYTLDVRVNHIDPAWPITAHPPQSGTTSIHVNPKFLLKVTGQFVTSGLVFNLRHLLTLTDRDTAFIAPGSVVQNLIHAVCNYHHPCCCCCCCLPPVSETSSVSLPGSPSLSPMTQLNAEHTQPLSNATNQQHIDDEHSNLQQQQLEAIIQEQKKLERALAEARARLDQQAKLLQHGSIAQTLSSTTVANTATTAMQSSRDPRSRAVSKPSSATVTDTLLSSVSVPSIDIPPPSSSGVNIFDLLQNLALPVKTPPTTQPSVTRSIIDTIAVSSPAAVTDSSHSVESQRDSAVSRTTMELVAQPELKPPALVSVMNVSRRSPSPAVVVQSSSSCSVISTSSSTDVSSSRTDETASSVQSNNSPQRSVRHQDDVITPSKDNNIRTSKSSPSSKSSRSPRTLAGKVSKRLSSDGKPGQSPRGKPEVRGTLTRRRTSSRDKKSRTKTSEKTQKDGEPAAKKSKQVAENAEHSRDSASAGLPSDLVELFGKEDVDLRTLPTIPKLQPPPLPPLSPSRVPLLGPAPTTQLSTWNNFNDDLNASTDSPDTTATLKRNASERDLHRKHPLLPTPTVDDAKPFVAARSRDLEPSRHHSPMRKGKADRSPRYEDHEPSVTSNFEKVLLPTPTVPPAGHFPRPEPMELWDAPMKQIFYDEEQYYVPEYDVRWWMRAKMSDQKATNYNVLIDGRVYRMMLNRPPCRISFGSHRIEIGLDAKSRQLYIDGHPRYRFGSPPKNINLFGKTVEVYVHGPEKKLWIDDHLFEINIDGPPEKINIGGKVHEVRIDSVSNYIIVDEYNICRCDIEEVQTVTLAFVLHTISFKAPKKEILIDGKHCTLDLGAKFPVIWIGGKPCGIRFDGEPRYIYIDDRPYLVPMDWARKCRIDGPKPRLLAFGGPGHEVIIDEQWFEVKFNGAEKFIKFGGRTHKVHLKGNPPEVKILPEVVLLGELRDRLSGRSFSSLQPPAPPVPPSYDPRSFHSDFTPSGSAHMPSMIDMPRPPVRPPLLDATGLNGKDTSRNSPLRYVPPADQPGFASHHSASVPCRLNESSWPESSSQPAMYPPAVEDSAGLYQPAASYQFQQLAVQPPAVQTTVGLPATTAATWSGPLVSQPATTQPQTGTGAGSTIDVNLLLQQLLAKGLIGQQSRPQETQPTDSGPVTAESHDTSASTTTVTMTTATTTTDTATVIQTATETTASEEPKEEELKVVDEDELVEAIPKISGLLIEDLRKRYSGAVQQLYVGISCSSCGLRFKSAAVDSYNEHLDWHFRQNRYEKEGLKVARHRRWYYDVVDWVQFEEVVDLEEKAAAGDFDIDGVSASSTATNLLPECLLNIPNVVSCPEASGDDKEDICDICRESFEQFWNEEHEAWHLKDAVSVSGKIYHPVCFEDAKECFLNESMVGQVPGELPAEVESMDTAEPAAAAAAAAVVDDDDDTDENRLLVDSDFDSSCSRVISQTQNTQLNVSADVDDSSSSDSCVVVIASTTQLTDSKLSLASIAASVTDVRLVTDVDNTVSTASVSPVVTSSFVNVSPFISVPTNDMDVDTPSTETCIKTEPTTESSVHLKTENQGQDQQPLIVTEAQITPDVKLELPVVEMEAEIDLKDASIEETDRNVAQ